MATTTSVSTARTTNTITRVSRADFSIPAWLSAVNTTTAVAATACA